MRMIPGIVLQVYAFSLWENAEAAKKNFSFRLIRKENNRYFAVTMYRSETKLRVRYGETDQMGYAYYGNYAEYYEVGRVEALRQLGLTYKKLEEEGILLPVYEFNIKYFKPAYYDDELNLVTIVSELPGTRFRFSYEMFNAKKEKLNEGQVTLVFIDKRTGKPCVAPGYVLEKIRKYF